MTTWLGRLLREIEREIEHPREGPGLAAKPGDASQLPPVNVVRIKRERPAYEKKEGIEMQYLKIDSSTHSVWCSCGQKAVTLEHPSEMNWWIVTHLVDGCQRPEAQFEAEFNQAAETGESPAPEPS